MRRRYTVLVRDVDGKVHYATMVRTRRAANRAVRELRSPFYDVELSRDGKVISVARHAEPGDAVRALRERLRLP